MQGLVRGAEGGGGAGQHQRVGAPVIQGDGGLLLGLLELQTPLPGVYNIFNISNIYLIISKHLQSIYHESESGDPAEASPGHQDGERDEGGERARLLRGQAASGTQSCSCRYF